MKYDVFISYSSKDQKIVEALSHYLESNRIRCFVAYRDIPKGTPWPPVIPDAIDNSQMMVVIFSKNFNVSQEVDREITICSKKKKPILTYRIEDTAFTGTKEYYLSDMNWIDAFPNPEINFGQLQNSIKKLISTNNNNSTVNTNIKVETKVNVPIDYTYVAPKNDKKSPNTQMSEGKKWGNILWTYVGVPICLIVLFPWVGAIFIAEYLNDRIRNRLALTLVTLFAQFIGNYLLIGILLSMVETSPNTLFALMLENIPTTILLLSIGGVTISFYIIKDEIFKK